MINKGIIESNKKRIMLRNKYIEIHTKYKRELKLAMHEKRLDDAFRICQELAKLPKNSSLSRVVNRCQITGRSRGLVCYKIFPICGIKLRENINKGYVPGVYKI